MVLFLLIGAIVASWKLSELTAGVAKEEKNTKAKTVIVVDPGHGGEDPGKVGTNDVLEKDLNLQIAKKVKKLLEEAGIKIVMTRENDKVPDVKKEDLNQRIQLINDTKPTLALCIHQNSGKGFHVKRYCTSLFRFTRNYSPYNSRTNKQCNPSFHFFHFSLQSKLDLLYTYADKSLPMPFSN